VQNITLTCNSDLRKLLNKTQTQAVDKLNWALSPTRWCYQSQVEVVANMYKEVNCTKPLALLLEYPEFTHNNKIA
jgi:hypothetical protein